MAKVKAKVNGEYKVTLTQEELNTISLLIGYSTDSLVRELASDYEIKNFSIHESLTDLYNSFYRHRTK